ncbi:glucosamine-6-phosphate deaminase [Waterburya agarophytonicola K14]|uniref:Glucosamine-6-phosphate deaminase n=1 Tax=Waterburya agarophytonicola KI4 TaxID=2874699 RepID=A0A964FG16_9CYAN|nr:glucosamine-6-phosphate deaminase [Waterburya agarophytonicola]MCC0177687.1 glucosamine-6-phosphate deaminase [Waterburya agarophytonicola KI4]
MLDPTLISPPDTQVVQVDELTVRITNSTAELTQDASALAIEYLQSLLTQQETASIILATGNSQLQFLDAIARNKDLDWSRIIVFHLDEYLGIKADHSGSFRYYLHHKVEKRVKPRIFHYINGDAAEPLQECDRYSKLLQQQAIDLCLLGIGDNGHLAFNEPNLANFKDKEVVKLIKLETKTRQQQVNGGYFPHLEAVPNYAYTLTIPTICAANKIFCLAGGKHKAEITKKTLENAIAPNFPATILRQQPQATLFCTGKNPIELARYYQN